MIPAEAVEALMDAAQDSGFVLKRSQAQDWLEAAAPYLLASQHAVTVRLAHIEGAAPFAYVPPVYGPTNAD